MLALIDVKDWGFAEFICIDESLHCDLKNASKRITNKYPILYSFFWRLGLTPSIPAEFLHEWTIREVSGQQTTRQLWVYQEADKQVCHDTSIIWYRLVQRFKILHFYADNKNSESHHDHWWQYFVLKQLVLK